MGKKRKCRMTTDEIAIHEEAIRLRRMTDQQLVSAFKVSQISPKRGDDGREGKDTTSIEKLLLGLAAGECKGVKGGIAHKVTEYAKEKGLIR